MLYRVFSLLGALIYVPARLIFPEDANDPMGFRYIISAAFFCVYLFSFVKFPLRKYLPHAVIGVIYLTAVWSQSLMFLNGLDPIYTTTFVMVTFISMWMLPSQSSLIGFIVLNVIGLILLTVYIENPQASFVHLWFHGIFALNVGYLADQGRLRNLEMLLKRKEEINYINYSAVGASRDGILLVNHDGKFIRANDNFFQLWGMEPFNEGENTLGIAEEKALAQVVEKDRFQKLISSELHTMEENRIEEFELLDGRYLEIYFIETQLNDRPLGRLWFFREITARKRIESNIVASEARLRKFNDSLTEMAIRPALHDGNLEEALKEVTKTATEVLGVDMASIWFFDFPKGKMDCRILYRKSKTQYESGLEIILNDYPAYFEMVTQSRIFSVSDTKSHPIADEFREGKHTGPTGALIHAHIRSGDESIGILSVEEPHARDWNVEDESYVASLADLFAVSVEVNRRKEIRLQIERYSAILKATFQLSETGILVLDAQGDVIEYNDLYLQTFEMTEHFLQTASYEEKVAHNLNQMKNADDIGKAAQQLRSRPGMETAGLMEFKDGRSIERYSKGLIINGEIVGRVWFYLDITERMNREQELMNRNFELDSFVYRASHDLKAPLNSIMGLINIIREEEDITSILTYVQMMDKSVSKLDSFIKQLTQFSQDARLQVVRKPIDLEEMILEIWQDLKYMDNAERVQLDLQVEQQNEFFSDPVRLAIVCNNIVSNSIKYQDLAKPQGTLKVRIESNPSQAMLHFEDNGLGISKEHQEKVFELFFRASVQATGSGLGLYITYNAVEKLGGNIDIQSDLGKGTSFTLHIPNRLDEAVPESGSPLKV